MTPIRVLASQAQAVAQQAEILALQAAALSRQAETLLAESMDRSDGQAVSDGAARVAEQVFVGYNRHRAGESEPGQRPEPAITHRG